MNIRAATCADAASIARVHVESWRTSYKNILPDAALAGLSYEQREQMWRRELCDAESQTFAFVLEYDAAPTEGARSIAGFAAGGKARSDNPPYDGELYAIYLLQSAQRRGDGARLFRAVANRLKEKGKRAMLVWVLAENPARKFYEKLGGVFIRAQEIKIAGARVEEVAYGWHLSF